MEYVAVFLGAAAGVIVGVVLVAGAIGFLLNDRDGEA